MEVKYNYSNRTFLVIICVCLAQFVTFLGITLVENKKREEIYRKLEIKRDTIKNISVECLSVTRSQNIASVLEELNFLIKKNGGVHVGKRQLSKDIGGAIQTEKSLLERTCTNETKICLQGFKGETGLPGDRGNPGTKGENGTGGQKGDSGDTGEKGSPGTNGSQGVRGLKGEMGRIGLNGTDGEKGTKGITGEKGETGSSGIVGIKGDAGSVGLQGKQGFKGIQGLKGTNGLKGETGDPGTKGALGQIGRNGNTPIVNRTDCNCIHKIQFVNNETVIKATFGSAITLNCTTADGQQVTWIHASYRQCYTQTNNGAIIEIQHLSQADIGEHICFVSNGVEIQNKTIVVTSDSSFGLSCNFENSTCPLRVDKWTLSNNIPDHTTGSAKGHFLYSSGIGTGSITSLWIPGKTLYCLSFWYRNGNIGPSPEYTVNVTVKDCQQIVHLLTMKNTEISTWTQEHVQLPANMDIVKIKIEYYTYNMVMQVDDIEILHGKCPDDSVYEFLDPKNETVMIPIDRTFVVNCSAQRPSGVLLSMTKSGTCRVFNYSEVHTIIKANFNDAGTYRCELNKNGQKIVKTIKVVVTGEEKCTFENGLCSWTQDNNTDQLDWITQSLQTPSPSTGPDSDHTFGDAKGHYLYMEASGAKPQDKAILQSQLLSSSSYCLSFAYSMYGKDMGSLTVFAKECHSSTENRIWSTSGDKGRAWEQACILTPKQSHDYRLYFEASRGGGYLSDIAIDDVVISAVSVNGTCLCALKVYSDFCNFETDFCHWHQVHTDDFDWLRYSGPTTTSSTGPDRDHTTGTGYYIYTESSSPRQAGDKAEIRSDYLQSGVEYCLTFYYHMYGSQIGSLEIYKENDGLTTTRYRLFTVQGNHDQNWHKQQVNIPPTSTNFRIVISGVIQGFTSDMALDDISITSGVCN